MAKAILDAIEQLEIYTTNKVQEWKEIMQRPSNSEEQDRVATAVWETYRDMANRIADLGELAEKAQKVVTTPDKHRYGHCPVCGRIYWDKCHVGEYCDSCGQRLEVEHDA
jgi:RNA polymerase-binding transcription factor DksA